MSTPAPDDLELPGQLAFKTSSSKKRKLSGPAPDDQDPINSSSPESVLPSCEVDDDPTLSFSATSVVSRAETPSYLRADSQPASSLPQRLQQQQQHASSPSLLSQDYASSAASSPCASAYADLSIDSDRGADETGTAPNLARSQSPFRLSRLVVMNGDANLPHRSSSPLKRRASSMDPNNEAGKTLDFEMASQSVEAEGAFQTSQSTDGTLPRAMSVDAPEPTSSVNGTSLSQRKSTT